MGDMKINIADYLPDRKTLDQKDRELKKACREFESIFTYQLLKSMRKTVDKCDLFHGGQGEEIYESLLDQELAKKMAGRGSNSLADFLFQQLKGHTSSESGFDRGVDHNPLAVSGAPQWPLTASVSSGFGWRKDPFTGENRFHYGIDLAAEEGTPVRASMSGKVLISDTGTGYGNRVVVDHGHGFVTTYAHNRRNLVKPGDWVRKGSPIAEVGSSGRSTGPHLHFEVKRNGKHLDPLPFLGP
jgi:murein DD-endopeptidase MepM/ murein hydrolase activator NlpD